MPFEDKTTDNVKRLGEAKLRDIVNQVKEEFSRSERDLGTWKGNLVRYNQLYNLVQARKHYAGLSNIFVPEILRAVETVVGKLYNIIFGSDDWGSYAGRDDFEDEKHAIAMTQLTRFQMDENGFKNRTMDSLRQMCLSGVTVRKILWDYRQINRTKPVLTKDKGREVKEEYETVRDFWTFEPVDLLGFHISDVSTPYNDIQKAEWIGEEYMVQDNWIRTKVRKGWFRKDLMKLLKEQGEGTGERPESQTLKDQRETASGFNSTDKSARLVQERWGIVPADWVLTKKELAARPELDEDDFIEGVIYLVNGIVAKIEENPFWHKSKPYVSCPYIPREGDFSGMGIAQIGEKLQEELNDTRNQTMDNKTLILMTMWLKSRASGIRNSDLRVRPMGVITTNDMKGLEPLRPPILTGVGVNIEGVVKEDLRQAVGAASNLQGIAQAGIDTATESSIVNRESLGRLMLTAELYGELILKPTLVFAEYLNYQFYDHVKVIKIVGSRGVHWRKMEPDEIVGNKDVIIRINTDSTENPAVLRQQSMNFLTVIREMPPELINFHWKLLDKIYGMFFKGRKLEEIYQPPAGEEELFSPDEEIELLIAGHPVLAKKGQDHNLAIQVITKELNSVKFAITEEVFENFKNNIASHEAMLQHEMAEMQAQFLMQTQAQQEQGQSKQGGGGKTPNASPYTQTDAPSTESLQQGLGF